MFTLLTGPFHPSLETSLVETVRQFKRADSLAPLAVIVPSEVMRRRLQWVLCAEHRLSLFHVSFLTFHQLVLRLQAERIILEGPAESGVASTELMDDRWYEWLVPWLLGKVDCSIRFERSLYRTRGMRQAIWRTIRDLQEGQVDPAIGLGAVGEGVFDPLAHDRLLQIFSLQAAVRQWSGHLQVGLPDDLTYSILPWVSQSLFLSSQAQVLYYGFYDLTQIQLSLLEEVAQAKPVKVFFPVDAGPAFQFAQRFLERYLLKGGVEHQILESGGREVTGASVRSAPPTTQVVSAVGEQGELRFACKSILRLVETHGYAFHDIGVVARNLETYSPNLTRIFQEHRIPFSSTATRGFLEDPWAKIWWQLAALKHDDYQVQAIMDILTSPYYRSGKASARFLREDAHWWWRLVRQARMIRGRADWERLAELADDESYVQGQLGAKVLPPHLSAREVKVFAHEVMRLIDAADACPSSGTVGEITTSFEALFDASVYVPGTEEVWGDDPEDVLRGRHLTECVERILSLLWHWDRLGEHVTTELWVERFRELVEEARMPLPGQSEVGVQVMDVMAARGHGFRALVILGLNDQVFPRVVREDAFLRDGDRRVLAESLGYKVDEKLKGLDEEALLFALLQGSAKERLYLLYQRADTQGRPLIPSSFLATHIQHSGNPGESVTHMPLSKLEGHKLFDGSAEWSTPKESRIRALLQERKLSAETSESPSWEALLRNGLRAVSTLERSDLRAGSFDGLVETDHLHWQTMQARGLSPTALERYVQCPLRFWMQEILGARDVREPVSRDLPPRMWGHLGHEVLQGVYGRLAQEGWPRVEVERVRIQEMIRDLLQEKALMYARAYGKGYLMLWQDLIRRLGRVIEDLVVLDQQESDLQGWIPILHEVEGTGRLPVWSNEEEGLAIHGRVDRVDQGPSGQGLRVVDYKFSWSRAQSIPEPDLFVEAGQGKRLQAPLYSWFSSFQGGEPRQNSAGYQAPVEVVDFRFIRPFQSPSLGSASFVASAWAGEAGAQLAHNISGWIRAMQQGQFFFLTGAHCRECSWSSACRSQHHPSWLRVQSLPLAREFRLLKKQRISHA